MSDNDGSVETENPTATNVTTPLLLPQNHPISFKLTERNYLVWEQQILATVRGYGLESFLTGEHTIPSQYLGTVGSTEMRLNPEYLSWHRQDQLLCAWIQSSLTESTVILVVGMKTSRDMWHALQTNFGNQSKTKIMQYKLQLQTLKKDALPMTEYLSKIKTCCDLLGAAGCRITEEDQILHILSGLGTEYDSVMVTITSKADSWKVQDVNALLLSFESRLESAKSPSINLDGSQPTANFTQTSGQKREWNLQGSRRSNSNYGRGEGARGSGYRGRGGRGRNGGSRISCQLCQKPGHTADKCWYRFEQGFMPQAPQPRQHQPTYQQLNNGQQSIFSRNPAAHVAQARGPPIHHSPAEINFDNSSSTSWYPDSGATNHITNDLSNLSVSSEYHGGKHLLLGNGHKVKISHIGHSNFLPTPTASDSRSLHLTNLLHIPSITKTF